MSLGCQPPLKVSTAHASIFPTFPRSPRRAPPPLTNNKPGRCRSIDRAMGVQDARSDSAEAEAGLRTALPKLAQQSAQVAEVNIAVAVDVAIIPTLPLGVP